MSTPRPDIAHTYDVTAGHYAAAFAGTDRGTGQVARMKLAITMPSRSPASSWRKWPAPSITG